MQMPYVAIMMLSALRLVLIAPLMLLMLHRAQGSTTDTLRVPVGADVRYAVEGGGRIVMVSGDRAFQRTLQQGDTVWRRLPYRPHSASVLYVHGDTIRFVDPLDTCRTSYDAGVTWTSILAIPNIVALTDRGRVAIATSFCEYDQLVVTLYDIEADTVRYLTSPIPCVENIAVTTTDTSCWVAAYGAQSTAAVAGDVWRVEGIGKPISMWEPVFVDEVRHVSTLRNGDAGLWLQDTMRPMQQAGVRLVMPYRTSDLGYPLDVAFDGRRWLIVMQSGVFASTNGVAWQRDAALSALMPLRCHAVVDSTLFLSVNGFGPLLWQRSQATPYNQGLIDPILSQPLLQLDDAVGHGDSWQSITSRGLVVWGDADMEVRNKAYGDVEQRRTVVHRGRIWAMTDGAATSYDVPTLSPRTEVTGQPVYSVVPMGQHDVIWQGRDLKIRRAGEQQWQVLRSIVTNDGLNGQILGVAGLADHVVVIGLVYDTQSDAMALRSFTVDSTGEDITGPRLITTIPAESSWATFSVLSADGAVIVWTGNGMAVSTDQGRTWLSRTMPFTTGVRPTVTTSGIAVWAAAPEGIWHTTDLGQRWQRTQVPLLGLDVRSVALTSNRWHLLTPDGVIRASRDVTQVPDERASSVRTDVAAFGRQIHVETDLPSHISLIDVMGRVIAEGMGQRLVCDDIAPGLYHCIVTTSRIRTVTSVFVSGY